VQRTREAISFWTYEGWLYLAVVLDLFSRRVIGWARASTQDETLIETASRMALLARRPAAELLFHSDRRSQYTSDAYRAVLAQAAISVSMSRTGNRYDNACPAILAVGGWCTWRSRTTLDSHLFQGSGLCFVAEEESA
jgi:transposase InsO family protein